MISYHPTLTPTQFVKNFFGSPQPLDTQEYFEKKFSGQEVYLTDSGSSAFALIIEALNLQGKSMILPAYVCDALLPVLIHYKIKPIFVDVDKLTFQPALSAYTDKILTEANAVLLVATYGRKPDEEIISLLKNKNKIIIEDYAGRSPLLRDPLISHARIYSLPKTLPVPNGGLAIIQKESVQTTASVSATSSASIKNVLKLLPLVAPLLALLRTILRHEQTSASWRKIAAPSRLTQTILATICKNTTEKEPLRPYTYCYPMMVNNPRKSLRKLALAGISAERIWHTPIIVNEKAIQLYNISIDEFPVTRNISLKIICVPLWHIENEEAYRQYIQKLQQVLPEFCGE